MDCSCSEGELGAYDELSRDIGINDSYELG